MARIDPAVLKAEIEADPAGLGYKVDGVWRSDAEIVDLLHLRRLVGTRQEQVGYADLLDRAPINKLRQIMSAVTTSDNAAVLVERLRYVGAIETAEGTRGRALIEGLVTDGILTPQQAAAFIAWGTVQVYQSRIEQLGWPDVVEADVGAARRVR